MYVHRHHHVSVLRKTHAQSLSRVLVATGGKCAIDDDDDRFETFERRKVQSESRFIIATGLPKCSPEDDNGNDEDVLSL